MTVRAPLLLLLCGCDVGWLAPPSPARTVMVPTSPNAACSIVAVDTRSCVVCTNGPTGIAVDCGQGERR